MPAGGECIEEPNVLRYLMQSQAEQTFMLTCSLLSDTLGIVVHL